MDESTSVNCEPLPLFDQSGKWICPHCRYVNRAPTPQPFRKRCEVLSRIHIAYRDRSWSNLVKSVRGKETCIGCEYNAGNVFCDPCGCKSPKKIADLTRCPLDRWRRPNLPPQKTA